MNQEPSTKPLWRTITVRRRTGAALTGGERMNALVRWLRGEPYVGDQFVDPRTARIIANPMEVNWAQFPLQAALNETPAKPDSEPPRTRRTPRSVTREHFARRPHDTSDGAGSSSPQSVRA